eukprot:TRINITY_DN2541_c0_g1_i1.p1 TRINITY_DN2541_c0_g1~~TRINITY_DN2541_c0_g1_i1.p1  ORF type:complete len:843 (-),score=426.72 TRINITY_DN2541_c0_g1_i1:34-2562(-)
MSILEAFETFFNPQNEDARKQASNFIEESKKQDFARYLYEMCSILNNEACDPQKRQMAGILSANGLRDTRDSNENSQRWWKIPEDQRAVLKQLSLNPLGSPEDNVRNAASVLVSNIAVIELQLGSWPEFVDMIVANVRQPNLFLQQGSLQCLGYVCESIKREVIATRSAEILNAVDSGTQSESEKVQESAFKALLNSLSFVKQIVEDDQHRNYLVNNLIGKACLSPNPKFKIIGLQCSVRFAELYYNKLSPYISSFFEITQTCLKSYVHGDQTSDEIVRQAIEFWSTIAEIEGTSTLVEEEKFTVKALNYVVPLLLNCLAESSKENNSDDDDEMDARKASSTCISLFSQSVGDRILPLVEKFASEQFASPNQNLVECAVLAFGSILEGELSAASIMPVQNILEKVAMFLLNPSSKKHLRDTSCWTVGRVAQFFPSVIRKTIVHIVPCLAPNLKLGARVASQACWAVQQVATAYEEDRGEPSSPFSQYVKDLLDTLFEVAYNHPEGSEYNLAITAFDAINEIVLLSFGDMKPILLNYVGPLLDELRKTFSAGDSVRLPQTCSLLQSIIYTIGGVVEPVFPQLNEAFFTLLKSEQIFEEALGAAGALCSACPRRFDVQAFVPYITAGIKSIQKTDVMITALNALADITSLGPAITPFCREILHTLMETLKHDLDLKVRPMMIIGFADIAQAIGEEFLPYFPDVMHLFRFAAEISVDAKQILQNEEYAEHLREGILSSYVIVLQALGSKNEAMIPFAKQVLEYIIYIIAQELTNYKITTSIMGLLGDIAANLGTKNAEVAIYMKEQQTLTAFIQSFVEDEDKKVRREARYAQNQIASAARAFGKI